MRISCYPAALRAALLLGGVSGAWLAMAQGPDPVPIVPTWPSLAERGNMPGRTFDISEVENISVDSGNLSLSIPLATLPPGPGGSGFSMGLVYNSQIWDAVVGGSIVSTDNKSITQQTALVPSSHGGGWNYSWLYSLRYDGKQFPGPYPMCTGQYDLQQHRLSVVFPDGSHHLLHLANYNGDPDGYYRVSPFGGMTNCDGTTTPVAGPLIYYTDDGTYSRLELQTTNSAWILYRPDNSRVYGTGITNPQVTQISDRNGNAVTFTYAGSGGNPAVTATDGLGRKITLSHGLSATGQPLDTVTGPGANGATLSWMIVWATTSTSYLLSYQCAWGADFPSCFMNPYSSGISSITLPSVDAAVLQYQFLYNSTDADRGGGELKSITMPYGETVSYSYQNGATTIVPTSPNGPVLNPVTGKKLRYTDVTGQPRTESWTYGTWSGSGTGASKSVTDPDGGTRVFYQYNLAGDSPTSEIHRVGAVVEPTGDRLDRVWRKNCPIQIYNAQAGNPYVKAEYRTVRSSLGDQTATRMFSYDRNGNPLTESVYGFVAASAVTKDGNGFPLPGVPSGAAMIRSTARTYGLDPGASVDGDTVTSCGDSGINSLDNANAYWNPQPNGGKLDTVLSAEISASGGTRARVEISYDNPLTTANPLTTREWDSTMAGYSKPLTDSNSVKTQATYDSAGNVTSTTDANGVVTSYSVPACSGPSGRQAYATTVTRAGMTTTYGWDCGSGLRSSMTDPNTVQTIWQYDNLGRTKLVKEAAGTGTERRTSIAYTEASTGAGSAYPLTVTTQRDLTSAGDGLLVTVEKADQRGRPGQTQRADTSVIQRLPLLAVSGDQASYEAVSNPYYTTGDTTMGWTRTKRDVMGRVVEVAHYAGEAKPAPWGSNSTGTGTATVAYDGYSTVSTDEGGHARRQVVDGAGRLKTVVEDPGSTPHLRYTTTYGYDFRDNLTAVTQGAQSRSFVYSSLGRLTTATNPETGATSYRYDGNGNLLTRTDARNIVTSYGFDDLNRLASKQYSSGTPAAAYCYDGDTGSHTVTRGTPGVTVSWSCAGAPTGSLLKMRRTMASAGGAVTTYSQYDELGRVKASAQTTNGASYPFTYSYNLIDGLTAMTYPSGRVVTYSYSGRGQVRQVSGTLSGLTTNYTAAAIQYAPHGALQGMTRGDGLVESWAYNNRMQASGVTVGPGGSAFGLSLYYCPGKTASCGSNNGNVMTASVQPLGVDQNFTYDGVNRLATAAEGTGWTENFGYDAAGNGWVSGWTGISLDAYTPVGAANFNAKNRLLIQNMTDASYDAAGNQLVKGGLTQAYDAENRQTSSTLNGETTVYGYDGDGRRVTKQQGSAGATVFVYDAQGRLAAEYGAQPPGLACGTCYVSVDQLGSTRVVTEGSTGQVVERHDYLPFGEDLWAGTGGRTTESKYLGTGDAEGLRRKFTGKERDGETGLDYFGARYFSGAQGRFTSPDPENASAFLYPDDPQSWNGYSYGRNNPLLYVDPDGMNYRVCDTEGHCRDNVTDEEWNKWREAQGKSIIVTAGGNILDRETEKKIGSAQYYNEKLAETLQDAGNRADVLIKDAAKTMAVNAAMTATGVIALRGLSYAAQSAQELGIFKNTKVLVNFAHNLMNVRPGHIPPPGGMAEAQSAVEGAIRTGNYLLKGNGLFEGTTQINGVAVGFRGRFVDGVARVATVFTKR